MAEHLRRASALLAIMNLLSADDYNGTHLKWEILYLCQFVLVNFKRLIPQRQTVLSSQFFLFFNIRHIPFSCSVSVIAFMTHSSFVCSFILLQVVLISHLRHLDSPCKYCSCVMIRSLIGWLRKALQDKLHRGDTLRKVEKKKKIHCYNFYGKFYLSCRLLSRSVTLGTF